MNLPMKLRRLACDMQELGLKMVHKGGEIAIHGRELFNAGDTARTWAEGIEQAAAQGEQS